MPASTPLTFDERAYSVEAIQKAAYRSMNSIVADITIRDAQIHCTLHPVQGISDGAYAHAVQEFKKEVLDQQLRQRIKTETDAVRNLILGIAFSRTGLQGGE